jgi:hypothetical protein
MINLHKLVNLHRLTVRFRTPDGRQMAGGLPIRPSGLHRLVKESDLRRAIAPVRRMIAQQLGATDW